MPLAAVGALADDQIRRRYLRGFVEKGYAPSTKIAREGNGVLASVLHECNCNHRATKNMSCVDESELGIGVDVNGCQIIHCNALVDRLIDILATKESRRHRPSPTAKRAAVVIAFVLLNSSRVFQHDLNQVSRGVRTIDWPIEPLSDKIGDVSTVIYVSMT